MERKGRCPGGRGKREYKKGGDNENLSDFSGISNETLNFKYAVF